MLDASHGHLSEERTEHDDGASYTRVSACDSAMYLLHSAASNTGRLHSSKSARVHVESRLVAPLRRWARYLTSTATRVGT
eukprot:6175166-Pleurochrysis_carterae.AAC.1